MTDSLVRLVVIVVALVVLVPLVGMAIFMPMGMAWHDPGWHGDAHFWGAWIGWFVTLVLIVAVAYSVYRFATAEGDGEAIEELRRAYARGELTDDEFEKRRDKLSKDDRMG